MSDLRVRTAGPEDVGAILEIKERLHVAVDGGTAAMARGGFLLGSSQERYLFFIAHAHVLLLEERGGAGLLGFSITLPDALLRASDLWARRTAIDWQGLDPGAIENARVGYLEQLAVLPTSRSRLRAPAFAMAALLQLAESGHEHIFTTVVREPLGNPAPLSLLAMIGACRVGHIEEIYPQVGRVVSDLYHMSPSAWTYDHLPQGSELLPLRRRIERMIDSMIGPTPGRVTGPPMSVQPRERS